MKRSPGGLLLSVLALCACAGGAREQGSAPRPDAAPSGARILDLDPSSPGFSRGEILTRLPAGTTVFFRNPDPRSFSVVRVGGDFSGCAGCVTVTGFACMKKGATSQAIQPGGLASLCFHEPGRFPVEVLCAAGTLRGTIEVAQP
jgi:hypothetical protein